MAQTNTKAFNHIAILGLGRSGQAVLDACICDGITVSLYDDQLFKNTPADNRAETYLEHFDNWEKLHLQEPLLELVSGQILVGSVVRDGDGRDGQLEIHGESLI